MWCWMFLWSPLPVLVRTRKADAGCACCGTQVHIKEGELVCPNCERKYKITHGIPNMLLHEDEV